MTTIHGELDEKFAPVREAFERNFTEEGDVGACVAVSLEGEMVVDLWGGHRDAAGQEPWQEDTIVNVYSSTKTMAAMCLLLLADKGEVDLYGKVADVWPEFAANGKEAVEVRHFLSHSAGLSGLDEPVLSNAQVYDWDYMVDRLAKQAPWWEPGTASGYHALTQGHLIGEVVRRVTGLGVGEFFQREIAEPMSADFYIGTPDAVFPRVGELIPPDDSPAGDANVGSVAAKTFANPVIKASASNTPEWRRAEIPAANGHGNARSIVRIQSILANGGTAFGKTLMSEEGTRRIFDKQTDGDDLVLGVPIVFGMGYGLSSDYMPMGPNEHIAYWGGWGGSTVVVDQDARLCVSYVMNRMDPSVLGDVRGFSLLQAAYQSLA